MSNATRTGRSGTPAARPELARRRRRNFILQQGFCEPDAGGCTAQYAGLQFQPRVILATLAVGTILPSPAIFLGLGAVLWWSALLPELNPFEAVYNATLGRRPGAYRIGRAPAPRRFTQGFAGTWSLAVAALFLGGWTTAAWVAELSLLAAVIVLAVGGFCLGSFLYHVLTGRIDFALRTLPWK